MVKWAKAHSSCGMMSSPGGDDSSEARAGRPFLPSSLAGTARCAPPIGCRSRDASDSANQRKEASPRSQDLLERNPNKSHLASLSLTPSQKLPSSSPGRSVRHGVIKPVVRTPKLGFLLKKIRRQPPRVEEREKKDERMLNHIVWLCDGRERN